MIVYQSHYQSPLYVTTTCRSPSHQCLWVCSGAFNIFSFSSDCAVSSSSHCRQVVFQCYLADLPRCYKHTKQSNTSHSGSAFQKPQIMSLGCSRPTDPVLIPVPSNVLVSVLVDPYQHWASPQQAFGKLAVRGALGLLRETINAGSC